MRTTDLPTDSVPAALLEPVQALLTRLAGVVSAHPDGSLDELENEVLASLRAVAPLLLAGVIRLTQRSLDPRLARARARCPGCGARGRAEGWRPRRLKTRLGTVEWERPWLSCRGCGRGFSPTDESLGLEPNARLSEGLRELVVAFTSACTFGEATRLLAESTGIRVGEETARTATLVAGTRLAEAQDAATAEVARRGAPPGPVARPPGQLVAEIDGVMVRYLDGWHEARVGVVGGWRPGPGRQAGDESVVGEPSGAARAVTDRGKLVEPSYVAAREPAAAFAGRWGAEAARRGALEVLGWKGRGASIAVLPRVVVVGDGAHWIWEAAAEQFGDRVEIVDYYHATEHIWTVAKGLFGDSGEEMTTWAKARRGELYEHGPEPVLAAFTALETTTEAERELVRRERGYFTTNRQRMRYPDFLAEGLPIGSGAVESSAKHLVQQRMKRAGMRWSEAGGRAMLALRAALATNLAAAA